MFKIHKIKQKKFIPIEYPAASCGDGNFSKTVIEYN
jgi:hypothetical protein